MVKQSAIVSFQNLDIDRISKAYFDESRMDGLIPQRDQDTIQADYSELATNFSASSDGGKKTY